METETTIKLPIVDQQERELRLYFMVSRPIQLSIPNEGIAAILSYDLDEAAKKVRKIIPINYFVSYLGYKTVNDLLKDIQLEGTVVVEPEGNKEVLAKEKISAEQFRNGLMLVANDYCSEEDKNIIISILEKVEFVKK